MFGLQVNLELFQTPFADNSIVGHEKTSSGQRLDWRTLDAKGFEDIIKSGHRWSLFSQE